jgi:hypothetical protein
MDVLRLMRRDRNTFQLHARLSKMPARNILIVGKLANPAVFGGALAARENQQTPSYEGSFDEWGERRR